MLGKINVGGGGGAKVTIDGEKLEEPLNLVTQINTLQIAQTYTSGTYGALVSYKGELHLLKDERHYKWTGKESYDGSTSEWAYEVSRLPYTFSFVCAVVYNDEIHILGNGNSSNERKSHYKWDGTSWTSVSTLPYIFQRGYAVVYRDELYIIGGGMTTDYFYKWNGTSWTKVANLPHVYCQYGCAVVYNDEIHMLSGYDAPRNRQHYKWDGNTWTELNTIPYNSPQYGCAVVYDNEIHVMGGHNRDTSTDQNCHYKWNGTDWTQLENLPYALVNSCATVHRSEIHAIAGSSTSSTRHYVVLRKSATVAVTPNGIMNITTK